MSSVLSRNHVFINSNNPSIHNQIIDGTQPIIKLPFPPYIDPYDLIVVSQDGKIPSRAPNAFIIYRKFYIETARNKGYFLPMTVISSMASQSWEKENAEVKEEYKRLSREAFDIRNEMLPKEYRKKKRGKWNYISFEKRSRKSPVQRGLSKEEVTNSTSEVNKVTKLTNNEVNNEPTSSVIPSFEQFNSGFTQYMDNTPYMNNIISSPEIPEMYNSPGSSIVSSPEIPEMYNSPGSSIVSSPEINDYTPPTENNLVETPILFEEELFNLIAPFNNEIRITEQFFNYNNFGGSAEVNPATETIMYSGNNFGIEPSELNFNFPYRF